jgi:hypothetical protein
MASCHSICRKDQARSLHDRDSVWTPVNLDRNPLRTWRFDTGSLPGSCGPGSVIDYGRVLTYNELASSFYGSVIRTSLQRQSKTALNLLSMVSMIELS